MANAFLDRLLPDRPKTFRDALLSDRYERGAILPLVRDTVTGQTQWGLPEIVAAPLRGAMLPGDVYAGRAQVFGPDGRVSQDVIERGADLAGGLTVGAAAMPAQRNAVGMGIRAYHGSPHDFDKFEWSPRTRGTGAGMDAESLLISGMAKARKFSPKTMAVQLSKKIDSAGLGKFIDGGDEYKTVSIEHSKSAGSNSTYLHFENPNGELATVRISDHSNAPTMGSVRREGSRQETPAIDLRPGDDLDDVVERLRAFFSGTLKPDMQGRLPKLPKS